MFSNNSIELNLLECCEKESFNFDKIDATPTETDSNAGKVAQGLQEQTYRLFQRKRAWTIAQTTLQREKGQKTIKTHKPLLLYLYFVI